MCSPGRPCLRESPHLTIAMLTPKGLCRKGHCSPVSIGSPGKSCCTPCKHSGAKCLIHGCISSLSSCTSV